MAFMRPLAFIRSCNRSQTDRRHTSQKHCEPIGTTLGQEYNHSAQESRLLVASYSITQCNRSSVTCILRNTLTRNETLHDCFAVLNFKSNFQRRLARVQLVCHWLHCVIETRATASLERLNVRRQDVDVTTITCPPMHLHFEECVCVCVCE